MRFALFLLILFFSSPAHADFRVNASVDTSPRYHCSLLNDGALISTGILCGIAAYAVENSVSPLSLADIDRLSPESVNRFDRGATSLYSPAISDLSWVLAGVTMAAPFALFSDDGIRANWRTFSAMYFEVMLFSYTLPALAKGIAERTRPYAYNPAVPLETKQTKDARASFFSRHTTCAFASAVFLSTLYDSYNPESAFKPWLWTVSIISASAVGYMRYRAGVHFPTDILTGAAVGSLIGYSIPRLHASRNFGAHASIDPTRQTICLYWKM